MNSKNLEPCITQVPDGDANASIDGRVSRALEEYAAALEKGQRVSRESLIENYADVAEELAGCLDSLEFIRDVAPQMAEQPPSRIDANQPESSPHRAALGDYRIIREIGRGGMGVVYEAEQLSLGRSVALKVLPYAAMMDQKAITRFKNEARAAATLDHPHIVPVYAVGVERGIHYYAMSLIDGLTVAELINHLRRSITDADSADMLSIDTFLGGHGEPSDQSVGSQLEPTIDSGQQTSVRIAERTARHPDQTRREVEAAISTQYSRFDRRYFRSVARLGAEAAGALDHAHQHGIVHRDIKPGNLIIDASTKLWVTDFGLARIESDAGMTMTGDLVGTLRYMAPEQALAQRVVVDHRVDIYSLGVSLYELLALRAPFDGTSREALLKQIAFDEPRPVRSVNRAVPEDLQTIIHKALSKNPDDRYPTAQEMADDLVAFVDDEPIKARPLSMTQRTARWATKRKGLVAAVAGILLLAVIGLSISTAMIIHERNLAKESEENERQQRLRAEANLDKAQDAVERLLSNVANESLFNAPFMETIRFELLEDALRLSEDLLAEQSADSSTRSMNGRALIHLGQIQTQLGNDSEAIAALEKAIKVFDDLVAEAHEASDRHQLAISHLSLAAPLIAQSRLPEAADHSSAAIDLCRGLVTYDPDSEEYLELLSKSLSKLGIVMGGMQRSYEAEPYQREAIDIDQRLTAANPDVNRYRRQLAAECHNLALTLSKTGQEEQAETLFKQAIQIQESLLEESRSDIISREFLAKNYWQLAALCGRADRREKAIENYGNSIDHFEKLVGFFPNTPDFRYVLADVYRSFGTLHSEWGNLVEARTQFDHAFEHLDLLADDYRDTPRFRSGLAGTYSILARQLVISNGDLEESADCLRMQIELSKRLAEDFPLDTAHRSNLASGYNNLGTIVGIGLEKPGDAVPHFANAITVGETLVREEPSNPQHVANLAKYLSNLANLQAQHWDEGEFWKSINELEQLFDESKAEELRPYFVGIFFTAASILGESDRAEAAFQLLRKCIVHQQKLASDLPEQPEHQKKLAEFHLTAGDHLFDLGRYEESEHQYEKAISTCQNLLAESSQDLETRTLLARSYISLGWAQNDAGMREDAAESVLAARRFLMEVPEDQRSVEMWENLGRALYDVRQWEEARDALENVIQMRGDDGPSIDMDDRWWYLTMVLHQLGETEKARTYYYQLVAALDTDPDRPDADIRLKAAKVLGIEAPSKGSDD